MNVERLLDAHYYSRPGFVDGTTEFWRLISDVGTGSAILEIGSGSSNRTSDFLATLGDLTGVDVSQAVLGNRALRRARVFDGRIIPFPDQRFDCCVSDYVLEHVQEPAMHFLEIARVLKPGGRYIFRTPNAWHYVTLVARLTPYFIHRFLGARLRGSLPEDAFPTFYRANTAARLKRLAAQANLSCECRLVEKEPSYATGCAPLFFPMLAYERIVNCTDVFKCLRSNLFGVAGKSLNVRRKPDIWLHGVRSPDLR